MQPEFTVINGKLHKNGKPIRPEFGNSKHIKAINKYHDLKSGKVIEPIYETIIEATAQTFCTCGNTISLMINVDYTDEISEFDGESVKCDNCKQIYEFVINEDENLIIKTI